MEPAPQPFIGDQDDLLAGPLILLSLPCSLRRIRRCEIHRAPFDEHMPDLHLLVEEIPFSHEHVRDLAGLERADAIGGAGNRRRLHSECT